MKFQRPVNNFASALAADHHASDGSLVLRAGDDAKLGALQSYEIYRVTLANYPESAAEVVLGIFEATGLSGVTLTGVTAAEGYADTTIPAGTPVRVRATRKTFDDIHLTLSSLAASGAPAQPSAGSGAANLITAATALAGVGATGAQITTAVETLLNQGGNWALPGNLTLSRPVFVDAQNWTLSGNGPAQSNLFPNGFSPCIIPYPRASQDGRVVTGPGLGTNRPDMLGVLDASVTGNVAGRAWGFATLGREAGYLHTGAAVLGAWSAGSFGYMQHDCEWRTGLVRGSTGAWPLNTPIWAYGDISGLTPSPVGLCFGPSPGQLDCYFMLQNGSLYVARVAFDYTLNRLDIQNKFNHSSKSLAIWVNGAAASITWPNGAPASGWGGNWLQVPTRGMPLQFGTSGWTFGVWPTNSSADVTFIGWEFDNALTGSPPADDHHCYLNAAGTNTVAYLDTTALEPGRLLTIQEGTAGRSGPTRAIILDANQTGRNNQPSGFTLSGFSVSGSDSPLLMAGNLSVTIENVVWRYGAWGLGGIRTSDNYQLAVRDSRIGGTAAAVGLFNTKVTYTNCVLDGGGTSFDFSIGCDVSHNDTLLTGFTSQQRLDKVFFFQNGGTWGKIELNRVTIDAEGYALNDVITCEGQQYAQRTLVVRGGQMGCNSCVNVFNLLNVTSGTQSYLSVKGFTYFADGSNATLAAGSQWYGEFDPGLNTTFSKQGAGAPYILSAPPASLSPTVRTVVRTANCNASVGDFVPCDATAGSFTVTLLTPTTAGIVKVKMIATSGGHTVTYACSGSDTFNRAGGSTSGTLVLLNQGVTLEYDVSTHIWSIPSDDLPLSQLDLRYPGLAAANEWTNNNTFDSGVFAGSYWDKVGAWLIENDGAGGFLVFGNSPARQMFQFTPNATLALAKLAVFGGLTLQGPFVPLLPTAITPSAGVATINCALNNAFTMTLAQNTAVTLTNFNAPVRIRVLGAGYAVTSWTITNPTPAAVTPTWAGGSVPAFTGGHADWVVIQPVTATTADGGISLSNL